MTKKFCVDCTHCTPKETCEAPQNRCDVRSPVSGEILKSWHWHSCEVHRSHGGFIYIRAAHQCGKNARWFVPIEPKP
jgi:hypothetical protein